MDAFDHYHPNDDVSRSFGAVFVIGFISVFLLLISDALSLLVATGESLAVGPSDFLMPTWHIACLLLGMYCIFHMLKMKTGHMIVRSYKQKKDVLVHPLGIKKFVTFSSWTLILNVMYFFLATIASFHVLAGTDPPSLLSQLLAFVFVTALSASFLTSTVVRFVILPGDFSDEEHYRRQFWFHNQMMHNFCTVFLVVEILLTSPQLEFVYMLFGILIALVYALFAIPFAMFGGGFYVYSFIDPRLQQAPLFITILALSVSLSYVGIWFVSELVSFNLIIGGFLMVVWCSRIVQFKPLNA